jgi:alanyl-tRNA synthetase
MKVDQLRQAYLDFFKAKSHKPYSSDSLVPADDPSLLFSGAGMNQFKPYFLGLKKDVKRATSCQKCLRTADLERVGKTAYHHSFFEMLGNFSFGDYFKEGAIEYAWEFVTQVLKLPKEKLWVSVYQDDDEAFNIWKNKIGVSEERIVRMGAEDNFWPSNAPTDGPNGPCGPCSEIYVGEIPGKGVEIWNLVFTQYDRQSDGSLPPLPQKNIDTGMGLERAAAVMQGVASNFDIDTFVELRKEVHALLKQGGVDRSRENAVMDHVRAVTFCIADGALPSNEGRGYVVRKIIRLATDHLNKAGAVTPGTLHKLVPAVVRIMGKVYPELADRQKTIQSIVENEERAFLEIVRTRVPELEKLIGKSEDPTKLAFTYYDTYGLPFEFIQATAASKNVVISREAFDALLEEQKNRSRQSSKLAGEIFSKDSFYSLIQGLPNTEFLGYESTSAKGVKVLRAIKGQTVADELGAEDEGLLIFDKTPFYAESGGQVGDSGHITAPGFRARVLDTQWLEKCAAHKVFVEKGTIKTGDVCDLTVEDDRRGDVMKNHTATHLLHSALRRVLGDHVKQSGSLVAKDYLRFDFTHFKQVDAESIAKIEELVNGEVKKDTKLHKRTMSKDEAVKEGAIAFFGEKYGDSVRVVAVGDFSKELCGGTHIDSTGQIGLFKIVSEGSIQAGVRRIEAVTGRAAKELVENESKEIEALARSFNSSKEGLPSALKTRAEKVRQYEATLKTSVSAKMREASAAMLAKSPEIGGVKFVTLALPPASTELFQAAFEYLKTQKVPFALLGQCQREDKVTFVVGASPEVVQKGFNAGKIVKELAAAVEGNGGGRPDFAVGGGKNPSKVKDALALGDKIVRGQLEGAK